MTEQSSNTKSRKVASRLMLGAAVLALPLTASITYAQSEATQPSAPPAVTMAAPQAPAAPSAPMVSSMTFQAAPEAPTPPEPSETPEPPMPGQYDEEAVSTIVTFDPDTGETKTIEKRGRFNVEADEIQTVKVKDKEAIVLRDIDWSKSEDGQTRFEKVRIINHGNKLDEAEMEVILEEVRGGLAEADEALKEMRIELKALENSKEWEALASGQGRTFVKMSCNSNSDDVATTTTREDGSTEVMICQSRIMAQALTGLEQAREAIASNSAMGEEIRAKVLAELDEQIESWKEDAR